MSRSDRILIAAGGIALLLAGAAGWVLLSPAGEAAPRPAEDPAALLVESAGPAAAGSLAPSATPATIVVDVQGAVVEPGIRELPAGSRVADAITAAGGYGSDVDIDAAAAAINLAEPLADGAQILVPRIGAAGPVAGADPRDADDANASAADDEPVNLNTASAEELEALPGIGPVTVDRIIEARREQPFTSLEDAVQRGVLNRGQLEDLQGIATAR